MFRNFLRIAIRSLYRNRTYSILNFMCLTFGLSTAIIAVLHILNVFSYDKFHKNYNRLFAVNAYVTYFNGDQFPKEYLSASLTDVLKEQMPEVEKITRITGTNSTFFSNEKSFTENGIYADDNFFDVFTFPIIKGNSQKSLTELDAIIISERMANKFFETTDCIGKILIIKDVNKQAVFKITGIIKNVPVQSSLQFDFVIPFSKFLTDNNWANETGASSNEIWVLLKNNVDPKFVENKIKNLIKNQETTLNQELFLFPLKEKILYSYAAGKRVWAEMQNLVIVGSIGFAILLIACFNFINLAIALNIKRYREAGIKKVVGSKKSTIVIQFLGETFFLTLICLFTAIIVSNFMLAGINSLLGNDIHFRFNDFNIILIFTAITIFTGLLSGLLPALYLASSSPVNVLKGKILTSHSYSIFRQGLIIFQFTIPIVLIISMMIIQTQDRFMRNFDVGLDKNKVIILDNSKNIQDHAESVKEELLSIPGIDAVSFTSCLPARGTRVSNEVNWDGKDASEKLHFWCISTDFDYNKTVDINLTAGRFFDKSFPSDSASYLINDVAAKVMKYENPVGQTITFEGKKGTIVGVFKDFHAIDLAGPIVPAIIRISAEDRETLLVKFSSGSYPEISEKIKQVYKQYEAESSFQPRLYNDLSQFSDLNMPSKLVGLAFIFALMLACLGLFGLASFSTESRTKEIGIRKTNGATTITVMGLLLTSYSKWLTISFFIALPVAFFFGKSFLGRFYFHAPIPLWTFFAGPLIACVVALWTVSLQSWRAARRNPVESLRYE